MGWTSASRWRDLDVSGRLIRLTQFFSSQGLTLVGNLLYGLLCVRLLPVADYAKFVVLFGVQGMLVILMDVNFSGTLIPLVGERVNDRQFIADYVASLRRLSNWAYLLVAVGLVFAFPVLVSNRSWNWQTVAAMVATLLLSTWFIRISSAYGTVLIILRDRNTWYKGQLLSSLGTLALLGLFWAAHALVAFTAILINVSGFVFMGAFYFLRARRLLAVEGTVSAVKQKNILRLAVPNIPQAIFYAIQGQVSLFLITYFGHTGAVASIGALGRLGQIFAVFGQLNPIFIEPYFGRLAASKLRSSYAVVLSGAAIVCTGAGLLAATVPGLFLWVLGPKYSGLHYEVTLAMATSAISTFSGVLWAIHSARKFVYWWTNIAGILLILLLQVLFILKADLGSIRAVLYLNLATNLASLLINCFAGVHGFLFGARHVEHIEPVLPVNPVESSGYTEVLVDE